MRLIIALFLFSFYANAQEGSGRIFHGNTIVNVATTYLAVATREVDLEASVATVDRARSYSFWFRLSNANRAIANRIVNISENTGNTNQMIINVIGQDNNTGVNGLLRCQLITNSTNLIYIQSQTQVERNRWHHLVWTYTGSEANTGFEMYIDGVKEASPTRNLTGTYTGAMNSANLRFKVGNHTAANGTICAIKNLAVWDKVLSDAEALELFNDGFPFEDLSTVSFYGNIVADIPLSTDLECVNNATFDLVANGTAPTFTHSEISVEDKRISFRRTQDVNTRYVAFGGIIQKGDGVYSWFGRSGTSHVLGGKIVRIDFDIDNNTAAAPVDVIVDGSNDLRGGSVGIDDNGDIHVFSSRYNGATDTFVDTGMYTSTDDGATFGSIELFETTESRFNFYGNVERGFAAGEFFVPFFEHDGAGNWTVSVFKTTDNWATHSKITVHSGSPDLGEFDIKNVGNNTFIGLARRTESPYGIYQIVSTNGGTTWGTPDFTTLGTTGQSNCQIVLTNAGKLSLLIMNRGGTYINQTRGNIVSGVIADETTWVTPTNLVDSYTSDSFGVLGYPNAVVLSDGRLLVTFSAEFSSSRADLYFGIGSL